MLRAGIDRVGELRGKDVVVAVSNDIGPDRRPLAQGLVNVRARQQIEVPAKLAGGGEMQIGFGQERLRQYRPWRGENLLRRVR